MPAGLRVRRLSSSSSGFSLERDLAGQHVPPHPPIPAKAEPGMLERRRPVVLVEEMTGPRPRIPLDERQQQQPRAACDDRREQQRQRDRRTDEVQAAARAIRVLAEVEGIELGERAMALHELDSTALRSVISSVTRRPQGIRAYAPSSPRLRDSDTTHRVGESSAKICCASLPTTTGLSKYVTCGSVPYFAFTNERHEGVYMASASARDFQKYTPP